MKAKPIPMATDNSGNTYFEWCYTADEVDAYSAKVWALVEAIRSEHITATYACLDMKGHGFALFDQLEQKIEKTKAALAALGGGE